MADINIPKEFLQEALSVIDTLDQEKKQLSEITDKKAQLEKALNTLSKNIETEKTKTIDNRRADLENEYNKKIKTVENEMGKISERRGKARQAGVKNRVGNQTAGLKEEIAGYKKELHTYCKDNHVSSICQSKLYHRFFYPNHVGEWLTLAIIFVLLFGALLASVMLFENKIYFIAVLAVDIVVILLYVLIFSMTRGKKPVELKICRQYIDAIIKDEKAIKNITKNIQRDKDDSVYDLNEYDNELNIKKNEITNIESQKTAALYQFDNVTKAQILGEIDSNYKTRLDEAAQAVASANAEFGTLTQKVTESQNTINLNYLQYLGSKNLNHDAVSKMLNMIETGEAVSVSDAVSKL